MKILVTGGRGFLGTVLVRKLQQEGHHPIALDSKMIDLTNPKSIEAIGAIDADFVFHLAGKTGVGLSWKSPLEFYRGNVDTTRHVLEACRIKKIPVHYVSTYIYGDQGPIAISEEAFPRPNNPYAHSKWMGEELCRFYADSFSIPITISRPFNIYGPDQPADFFIPRMIGQLQNETQIKPLGLHAKRDFIFVEDVVDALIGIMKRGKIGNSYNIGTGICYSCKEVIEELQKLMNVQKSIVLEAHIKREEIPHAQANIRKVQTEIGWQPKYSLCQGLTECLKK